MGARGGGTMNVKVIEDLEYIGYGRLHRGSGVGPCAFDFGDFGINESCSELHVYVSPDEYERFKREVIGPRREHGFGSVRSSEAIATDDRGFKPQWVEVEDADVERIRTLAGDYKTTGTAEALEELIEQAGPTDSLAVFFAYSQTSHLLDHPNNARDLG